MKQSLQTEVSEKMVPSVSLGLFVFPVHRSMTMSVHRGSASDLTRTFKTETTRQTGILVLRNRSSKSIARREGF